MAEIRNRDEVETDSTRDILKHHLENLGIEIPDYPDSHVIAPRKWLLRAESNSGRLIRGGSFLPQSGEMGSEGVFFGDCYSSLMYPQPGIYYLFDASSISKEWLVEGSDRFDQIQGQIARERNLNLSRIGDGITARSLLFKKYFIYQPNIGVATSPVSIAVSRAQRVFVTPELGSSLPPATPNEIIILEQSPVRV